MVTRTDGSNEQGNPALRSLRDDAAIAIIQGLLANPNTHGTETQIGPPLVFTAVSLADQLVAELRKEKEQQS